MIDKAEIDSKSAELDVHVANVQRDYVFGWLLAGLYQSSDDFGTQLILKGGNAYRKAYFESARFSNDLDFSTETEIDADRLRHAIVEACKYSGERSGVVFAVDDTRVNERASAVEGSRVFEARVYFKSFYAEEDISIKVDLDVKEFDRIHLPIQSRQLIHDYSDADACQATLRCWKLEELLAGKLKALLQRQHSPDLYDFVYSVFFQKALEVSRREIITTFLKKTIYEPSPLVARRLLLDLPFHVLRGLWDRYLVCPRPARIEFDEAEDTFRSTIEELFGLLAVRPTPPMGDVAVVSHYGSSQRNMILEAGRLQKLLRLTYDGISRVVEPYALVYKRRKDGVAREYFYVWDRSGGRSGREGIKSLFPEKVHSLKVTDETFTPRYPIELTKGTGYFARPFSNRPSIIRSIARPSRSTGPKAFTIECPYCMKKFKRATANTRLNAHKDRYGNPCYGRVGFLTYG